MENTFFFLLDSLETPTFFADSKTRTLRVSFFHSCRAKNNLLHSLNHFLMTLQKLLTLVDLNMVTIFEMVEHMNVIFRNLVP